MSKELEALKNIKIRCHSKSMKYDPIDFDLDTIEKSLKALEIIKEKRVDIESFYTTFIENSYNYNFYEISYGTYGKYKLTQEEFNLLKEVIE